MLCIKVCTNTWGWFLLRSPRLVVLKLSLLCVTLYPWLLWEVEGVGCVE